MRVEPHGVGSIVHVIQRGSHGIDIVRDLHDKENFKRSLFYINDVHTDPNWRRETGSLPMFERPQSWPEREPLVEVLAWTLLSNHYHLLLREISEGGIAKFMQRLNGSMSVAFNKKYHERGSLFQGGYRGKAVADDAHLAYLMFYLLVKNVLNMYPGGLAAASTDFDKAWKWATQYQYSSFRECITGISLPISAEGNLLAKGFIGIGDSYKQEAKELLAFHQETLGNEFGDIMLEPW